MAQLPQGFGFDLPNPLAGDVENLSDFFKSFHPTVVETVTQSQYVPFAGAEGIENAFEVFAQQALGNLVFGGFAVGFDEISQPRIFFFTDGGF